MAALQAHRDQAVGAWEKALAASVVHYVNDALQDLGTAGTEDYAFGDHAKHWSELKGFALALQFNPRSPLGSDDFDTLHGLIGQRPADVMKDDLDARMDDLVAARELLGDVYGFDAANLGDAFGEGGW
jgi:hypothetical protein